LALREELIRQEKLEQLAARFNRKASMRETWLSENQRLVSQDNFGFDLPAVEAAAKKHEAIETDIFAYEERVLAVVAVAQELEAENYHDIERINSRKENVLRLWEYLLELLRARRLRLEASLQLQQGFQVNKLQPHNAIWFINKILLIINNLLFFRKCCIFWTQWRKSKCVFCQMTTENI